MWWKMHTIDPLKIDLTELWGNSVWKGSQSNPLFKAGSVLSSGWAAQGLVQLDPENLQSWKLPSLFGQPVTGKKHQADQA